MPATAEAIVIGGGVIGCSILYHLAARGVRHPLLLERDLLGSGSTGRSLAPIHQCHGSTLLTQLARQSLEVFQNFSGRIGGQCGYTPTGCLHLKDATGTEGSGASVAAQESGSSTRLVSRVEAGELAPLLRLDEVAIIAYDPDAGHADASATAFAYADRARQLGAEVRRRDPVLSLEVAGDRQMAVSTATERIVTPLVVLATGAWTAELLASQGIGLPLVTGQQETLALRRPPIAAAPHVGVVDLTNGIYFRPEGVDLTLLTGISGFAPVDDPAVYPHRASTSFVRDAWIRLIRRFPALEEARLSTTFSGLVTTCRDRHPILDRVAGIEGLYLCVGFGRYGVALSPAVGALMAELVWEGSVESLDISPLRWAPLSQAESDRGES